MNANILFWSSRCPLSANILNILRHENLLNSFKLICVDNNIGKIPPQIRVVPTMIVVGQPQPIVAKDIYNWIQNIKFIRQQQPTQQNNQISQQNNNGPFGFLANEMNNFSDTFAYKDVDIALPQNFLNVGDEKATAIFTAPTEKQTIKKNEQQALINNLVNKRKGQEKEFSDIMKKEQMYAILNNT